MAARPHTSSVQRHGRTTAPQKRRLPTRERVFITSLLYHGYRLSYRRHALKYTVGYVIPATALEDACGIDVWVKPRGADTCIPVQLTQRGTRLFRKYHRPSGPRDREFQETAVRRLREKRTLCRRHQIAFVIVRDHDGERPSRTIAWGDVKALHFALRQFRQ